MRRDKLSGIMLPAVLFGALLLTLPSLAAGEKLHLPPVSVPASGQHHVGQVILVELATPDLAASERFYGALLGWTFRDTDAGGTRYAEAMLAGHSVAGLFQRSMRAGEHRRPAWLTYFSVRNSGAAVKTAIDLGGRMLFGPRDFPDRGSEAVLADPQGAVFAVLDSSSGDPPHSRASPGEWIWSSLITADPDAAAAFYQNLFGYDVFALPPTGPGRHLILGSDGFARASVNSLPASRPHEIPHWLDFVRVSNVEASAERAVSLGGQVLIPPRAGRAGEKIALIADPLGAVFGLLQAPKNRAGEPAP